MNEVIHLKSVTFGPSHFSVYFHFRSPASPPVPPPYREKEAPPPSYHGTSEDGAASEHSAHSTTGRHRENGEAPGKRKENGAIGGGREQDSRSVVSYKSGKSANLKSNHSAHSGHRYAISIVLRPWMTDRLQSG